MKQLLLIVIFSTFFAVHEAAAQTEKQITAIRNDVNLINKNAKNYDKTTKDIDGISLEGTEATYFASGRGVKKVIVNSFGETYKATTELYFGGEELIFAFQKFSQYDTQIGLDKPVKVVKVTEQRLYFSGGKLIRFLEGKTNVKKTLKRWSDREAEIRALAKAVLEAYP